MKEPLVNTKVNIAIYIRESRDDNFENYETIENQKGLLIDFVKKNNLGNIYDIYIDDNVSGSSFERAGLKRFQEDAIQGKINLVVLKDLSRLGRNNAKTLLFLEMLEELGIRVITSDGRFDSLMDNEMVGIETWVNERYVRDISRKIRASIKYKIQTGEFLGKPPYGYIKSPLDKNRLIPDTITAPIIREIFKMYSEGCCFSYIAKKLDKLCILPPAKYTNRNGVKSQKWNIASIHRILKNQVYIGYTIQGTSERINYKSTKMRRLPREKWTITPNTHEAIIDVELFEEVQKKLKKFASIGKAHKGIEHLFKGLVYCGTCGNVMYARTRPKRDTAYICSNYVSNGKEMCSSHYIKESILKQIVVEDIFELLDNCIKTKSFENQPISIEADNKLKGLIKQLKSRQKQQECLYMDKLDERITLELFNRMNILLENDIDRLKGAIELIKNTSKYVDKSTKAITIQDVSDVFSNIIAKYCVERIIVYGMTITVDFKYKKV